MRDDLGRGTAFLMAGGIVPPLMQLSAKAAALDLLSAAEAQRCIELLKVGWLSSACTSCAAAAKPGGSRLHSNLYACLSKPPLNSFAQSLPQALALASPGMWEGGEGGVAALQGCLWVEAAPGGAGFVRGLLAAIITDTDVQISVGDLACVASKGP